MRIQGTAPSSRSASSRFTFAKALLFAAPLLFGGCTNLPESERTDFVENTAQNTHESFATTIPSPPVSAPPATSTSLLPPTSISSEDHRAVAVVTAACVGGWGFDDVFIPARRWDGMLWEHAQRVGVIESSGLDLWQKNELRQSMFITEAFETAATLDARWQPLLALWDEGTQAVISAWEDGLTFNEALGAAWPAARRLEARCRVPFADSKTLAAKTGTHLSTWVFDTANGLLDRDLLLPAR